MDPGISVQTKTSQVPQRSLQKFLEPDRKPKVIYTDNSLKFGKACEDLSLNHCTSTPHRSETNGIAERAVRRVKEGTFAVLLQPGLKENWWADSMECHTCHLMGKHPMKDFLGNHLKDQLFHSVHWWSISLFLQRTVKNPSIWKKVSPCSSDALCTRGEFGRVTSLLQTLRCWKRWTHRKFMQRDSMQRK